MLSKIKNRSQASNNFRSMLDIALGKYEKSSIQNLAFVCKFLGQEKMLRDNVNRMYKETAKWRA